MHRCASASASRAIRSRVTQCCSFSTTIVCLASSVVHGVSSSVFLWCCLAVSLRCGTCGCGVVHARIGCQGLLAHWLARLSFAAHALPLMHWPFVAAHALAIGCRSLAIGCRCLCLSLQRCHLFVGCLLIGSGLDWMLIAWRWLARLMSHLMSHLMPLALLASLAYRSRCSFLLVELAQLPLCRSLLCKLACMHMCLVELAYARALFGACPRCMQGISLLPCQGVRCVKGISRQGHLKGISRDASRASHLMPRPCL